MYSISAGYTRSAAELGVVSIHASHAGGDDAAGYWRIKDRGSSPRVWGQCHGAGGGGDAHRFIPTRVGNIFSTTRPNRTSTVHPHACGEHDGRWQCAEPVGRFIPTRVGNISLRPVPKNYYLGSSPRVWGTCLEFQESCHTIRFIPTRVGNMLQNHRIDLRSSRFIPTRVGNMPARMRPPGRQSVHPHACGEHSEALVATVPPFGSSPRVWGT